MPKRIKTYCPFTNLQSLTISTWLTLTLDDFSPRSPLCSRAFWTGCWCETRLRGPRPARSSSTPSWRRRVRRPASSLWWGRTGWDETCDTETSRQLEGSVCRFRWNRILLHTEDGPSEVRGHRREFGGKRWELWAAECQRVCRSILVFLCESLNCGESFPSERGNKAACVCIRVCVYMFVCQHMLLTLLMTVFDGSYVWVCVSVWEQRSHILPVEWFLPVCFDLRGWPGRRWRTVAVFLFFHLDRTWILRVTVGFCTPVGCFEGAVSPLADFRDVLISLLDTLEAEFSHYMDVWSQTWTFFFLTMPRT